MAVFQAEWKINSRLPCWAPAFLFGLSLLSGVYRSECTPHYMRMSPYNDKKKCLQVQKCSSFKNSLWWKHILNYLLDCFLSQCMRVLQGTMASLILGAHDVWRRMYGQPSQMPHQESFVWNNMQALFLYTGEAFVNFYIIQKYTTESQEFSKWTCKNIPNQKRKKINLAE